MELKLVKKGDPIFRTIDKQFIGFAAADGVQITPEPHEIAAFRRCLFVTNTQLTELMRYRRIISPIQIQIGNPP